MSTVFASCSRNADYNMKTPRSKASVTGLINLLRLVDGITLINNPNWEHNPLGLKLPACKLHGPRWRENNSYLLRKVINFTGDSQVVFVPRLTRGMGLHGNRIMHK
jgi:hypothetical protein